MKYDMILMELIWDRSTV